MLNEEVSHVTSLYQSQLVQTASWECLIANILPHFVHTLLAYIEAILHASNQSALTLIDSYCLNTNALLHDDAACAHHRRCS
jgi:hypothetical protein